MGQKLIGGDFIMRYAGRLSRKFLSDFLPFIALFGPGVYITDPDKLTGTGRSAIGGRGSSICRCFFRVPAEHDRLDIAE